jgi:hypothetical protein
MAEPNRSDLHRDFGRMEGHLQGLQDDVTDIKTTLERVERRLAKMESRESELRGAWWVLAAIATVFGVCFGVIVNHFWK